MEVRSNSTFEKDKHIDDFYQFCGPNLERYLNLILTVFKTEKLNEFNLSEQFDNLNK